MALNQAEKLDFYKNVLKVIVEKLLSEKLIQDQMVTSFDDNYSLVSSLDLALFQKHSCGVFLTRH